MSHFLPMVFGLGLALTQRDICLSLSFHGYKHCEEGMGSIKVHPWSSRDGLRRVWGTEGILLQGLHHLSTPLPHFSLV